MSYGMSGTGDEQKVSALEAQAADLESVAKTLDATQPAAAADLMAQVAIMRQEADKFRQAASIPRRRPWHHVGSWSPFSKLVGLVTLAAGAYWLGQGNCKKSND